MCLFSCASVSHPTTGKRSSELSQGHTPVRRLQHFPLTLTKTDQPEEQGPIPSHIVQEVDPSVWNKEIPRMAIRAQPVRIHLRPEAACPNKKQGGRKKESH